MVQETTSDPGDRVGSANPTWSKIEQRTTEGGPPECAGRSLEGVGNGSRRWMVADPGPRGPGEQNPAYRPARPHHPPDLRAVWPRAGRVPWEHVPVPVLDGVPVDVAEDS